MQTPIKLDANVEQTRCHPEAHHKRQPLPSCQLILSLILQ